ncbi:Mitochondrial glycoprotein, putative [Leishmania lindenbergi]|uniref:Mitochondrial glycoprotein n=1 Tax=Leishmania lindenbergi TaxID=651832 RepID=A0AAW3ARB5_9TRYP
MTVSTRYCSSGLQNGGEWQCGSSAGGGCNDSAFGSVEEQRSDRLDRGRVMEDDDDDDAGWDASPSSSDAFSTSASPVPLPPQSDPTAASERAALDQRRRLFAQCSELADVVQEELRAEVARDMKDGVTAVPPLAPSGWQVLHTTGSSYFTMSRLKKGSYVDSRASGWRPDHDDDSPQVASDVLPRYRSVHDLVTGGRHRPHSANHEDTAAERREMWALHRGRYTAAQEEEAASKRSGPTDDEGGRGQDGSGRHRNAVRYARSDMHITLFAPFRSLDLTLHDPRVDICEWTRFDVLIRKERPKAAMVASSPAPTLAGQEGVWDEGRCMFLRLACANSELRVRSLQFVSNKLARGLEEHAVFGKGEPLYLEMLRRLPINVSFQQRSGSTLENKAQSSTMSAASPVNVFDAPEPTPVTAAAAARRTASSFNSAHVLTSQFDRSGEYARTFAYAGPCITELSKELREALSEYVMMDVGITNEVAEYVCQLQFFLEQEEYVGWLAQWGQLAATLKQTL